MSPFIASFAFVLPRHRARPIPLKMHERVQRLPCVKGAVVVATEGLFFATFLHLQSLRLAFARHLHLHKGGFFVSFIITQIGRGNNPSAEIFMLPNSPLRMQREAWAFFFFYGAKNVMTESTNSSMLGIKRQSSPTTTGTSTTVKTTYNHVEPFWLKRFSARYFRSSGM